MHAYDASGIPNYSKMLSRAEKRDIQKYVVNCNPPNIAHKLTEATLYFTTIYCMVEVSGGSDRCNCKVLKTTNLHC